MRHGHTSVWEAAAAAPVVEALDCSRAPAARCSCEERLVTDPRIFDWAPAADLPGECEEEVAENRILEYRYRGGRPCGRHAIEISGGFGGTRGPEAQRDAYLGATSAAVDVYVHLFILRTANATDILAGFQRLFGARLRAAAVEVLDSAVTRQVTRFSNRRGALSWLSREIGRRGAKWAWKSPGERASAGSIVHTLSMWRKVHLASALRRTEQRACGRGHRYELVLRERPDGVPAAALDLDALARGHAAPDPRARSSSTPVTALFLPCQVALPPPNPAAHRMRTQLQAATCRWRRGIQPLAACLADDQLAVGRPEAIEVLAALYVSFSSFAWWYPLERADASRNFAERLLMTYLDWRRRSALALHGLNDTAAEGLRVAVPASASSASGQRQGSSGAKERAGREDGGASPAPEGSRPSQVRRRRGSDRSSLFWWSSQLPDGRPSFAHELDRTVRMHLSECIPTAASSRACSRWGGVAPKGLLPVSGATTATARVARAGGRGAPVK